MVGPSARESLDGEALRLEEIRRRLLVATDRRVLSGCLDDLAVLAGSYLPARFLLLEVIVERGLVEVSVRSMFFDDSSVDDAVQETALAVAVGVASFRSESSFLTWLDRVARNAAGQLRRRRVPEPVDKVPGMGAWATRMSSIAADREVIKTAMDQLSADHQDVLVLREVEDLTYEEISDRLGLPLNTVRTRLRRARHRLATVLVSLQMEQ